jgi:hypothetical protein
MAPMSFFLAGYFCKIAFKMVIMPTSTLSSLLVLISLISLFWMLVANYLIRSLKFPSS